MGAILRKGRQVAGNILLMPPPFMEKVMLSFTGMLLAPFDTNKKERKKPVTPNSGLILKARSQERYRLIMEGKTLSTGELANIQGIPHMGCLSSLYQMEKDGFIVRKGTRAKEGRGKATILWGWK